MPLVVYYKPTKARSNSRLERLKDRVRHELGRQLTDHEEHLLELSAALLDREEEQEREQAEGGA